MNKFRITVRTLNLIAYCTNIYSFIYHSFLHVMRMCGTAGPNSRQSLLLVCFMNDNKIAIFSPAMKFKYVLNFQFLSNRKRCLVIWKLEDQASPPFFKILLSARKVRLRFYDSYELRLLLLLLYHLVGCC